MHPSYYLKLYIKKIIEDIDISNKKTPEEFCFSVEPPRENIHGDLTTNAAMILAQQTGQNPRLVAEKIVEKIICNPNVSHAEVAGPGFINCIMHDAFWHRILEEILDKGVNFGRCMIGKMQKVNIEYVSANPTGPMHLGHCRGAVVGDVLAHVLSFCGYDITKEYYINDAGLQIDTFARSVMIRYREALGEACHDIPSGFYPGDYLIPLGKALASQFGSDLLLKPEAEALQIIGAFGVHAMIQEIREDLKALGVHHDVFFHEKSLHEHGAQSIKDSINKLTLAGYIYRGKLPAPKGKPPEDFDDREHILFRSSSFGDDSDRALVKADGSFTYFASDIAYLQDKILRGFTQTILILGSDHAGYVKRMEALAYALSDGKVSMHIVLCNLVKLLRDGNPVRMSKRAGEFITLRNVVDEVGRDALRFMMLYRKSDAPLDFDFSKVLEQSKDNPVFYVQYAVARCHSIFRQFQEQLPTVSSARDMLKENCFRLTDKGEIGIIRKLSEYPRVLESVVHTYEPHRLAFYLHDLASSFHAHWNRGIVNLDLRFVKVHEPQLAQARLGLVHAVCDVLTSGLSLVGIEAPVEMYA